MPTTSRKKSAAPAPQQALVLQNVPLHQHTPPPHTVRNANEVHSLERGSSFNTRVAVWLTKNTGTMQCAYIFAGIGIGSLVGVFTGNVVLAAVFGSISSYFLQLVLLPVLSVGQGVLGRHAELQADEMFKATMNTLHDTEQMIAHLNAQDAELLKQTAMLAQLVQPDAALSVQPVRRNLYAQNHPA